GARPKARAVRRRTATCSLLRLERRAVPRGSRARLAVRLTDQLLAAGPAEGHRDEDHGESDAPGGGDQLLAGRVGEGGRTVDVLVREGGGVDRLVHPCATGRHGDDVR